MVAKDACTGFQVSRDARGHVAENNLHKIPSSHCYLEPIKTESIAEKITGVILVRGQPKIGLDLTSIRLYDGISDDLNRITVLGPLHLLWKTFKTHPV